MKLKIKAPEPYNFADSLALSHAAADLPFWEETYRAAFPTMAAMIDHRKDGAHQRAGIDRSIILENASQILVDEKVRWRNRLTGLVYEDIAIEYRHESGSGVNTPGWVCKSLLCEYIAYAIAPLGLCYLLPVLQLQKIWGEHGAEWIRQGQKNEGRRIVRSENEFNGRTWTTYSVTVTPEELYPKIGGCLRVNFTPCE